MLLKSKNLWNTTHHREKANANLLDDKDIQTLEINGKSVIAINVHLEKYSIYSVIKLNYKYTYCQCF